MINYIKTQAKLSHQQYYSGSKFLMIVDAFMATAGSSDDLQISARLCKGSMGAGGTTETNHRSRIVNDLRDFFVGVLMEVLMVLKMLYFTCNHCFI